MKLHLTNLNDLMTCPICEHKSLQITELVLDDYRRKIEFECLNCGRSITDEKHTTEDFYKRMATQPLDYFKQEIEERKNARTNG
jgi:transcription elongation factor Elf1